MEPQEGSLEDQARKWDGEFASLTADERIRRAYSLFGSELIATTSFGRDAGVLLHHLHRHQIPIRVFFINTTFYKFFCVSKYTIS